LGIVEALKLEPSSLQQFLGTLTVPTETSSSPATAQEPAGTTIPVQPVSAEPSVQQKLQEALFGIHQDWAVDFLIDRGKITAGQTILDVPSEYCERALSRLQEFRDSVIKYGKEHDNIAGVDGVGVSVQINA
jgi:hypothetical protein